MEVEDHLAAQAPTNVGKGKEIATLMLTVLATWNAARATVWMTTAILPLDFRLTMTAAMTQPTPTVSNIKASYQYFYPKVWLSPELKNAWKRLGLQWKDEIHFQFDFYRMCWWKCRTKLLHKLQPMWGRGRWLRLRCWLCWQLEMRPGQRLWWQLRYFPWISVRRRLLLWP